MSDTKESLIIIDDWGVCKYESEGCGVRVYGEHHTGCQTTERISSVAYEYKDTSEKCWKCGVPVPKEIVALVLMYNWDKI